MGKLTGISAKAVIAAFNKLGYEVDHQTGSHVILYRAGSPPLSIPNHREVAPGLLRGLIRRAGLEVDAFLQLLP